jgi:hypothetical protein
MVNNSCGSNTSGNLYQTTLANSTSIAADSTGQLIPGTPVAGFFSSVNVQTFTTSGTYTPTAGMLYCLIEMVGGGGGGGGATTTTNSCGSGGGNGEYASGVFSAASIGVSQSLSIGAGGSGNSAASGSNGGNTSVGALISANGGSGGAVISLFAVGDLTVAGGAGGTGGSGGSVRFPGANGTFAYIGVHAGSIGMAFSGQGNPGPFTGGSTATTVANGAVVQASDGNAATGFGGGGGGALDYSNGTAQTGGAGSAGYVIITEYIG